MDCQDCIDDFIGNKEVQLFLAKQTNGIVTFLFRRTMVAVEGHSNLVVSTKFLLKKLQIIHSQCIKDALVEPVFVDLDVYIVVFVVYRDE